MTIPKQKLQAQWKQRNNAIKANARQQGKEDQTRETEYTKHAEKTDITQLVAKRPEMPEEMELNRESRAQLAELIPEYPTKTREPEKEDESEETEQRRNYTCLNCKKPFGTTIGGNNHIRHTPDCREAPQKGEFANRCLDCDGTFREPNELRKHRKYVCARSRKSRQKRASP